MKAIIASKLNYPGGDAGSIRHAVLAKMLRALGYQVIVAALGPSNGRRMVPGDVPYTSLRYGGGSKADKIKSHLLYQHNLKKLLDAEKPDVILTDDLGPAALELLARWGQRHRVTLVHDSVEWYSPEQFARGKWAWPYCSKDIVNRRVVDERFRVIAISRYLAEHFTARGCACVRIPIVLDKADLCREKQTRPDAVTFTYAGQPGRKDYLHLMLEAFCLLDPALLRRARLRIIGCTWEQLLASGIPAAQLDRLAGQLELCGRIPHAQVLEALKTTDFTLLMRSEEQRYARAGFPTKVVESLSRSTPVICNLTSDLGLYLRDGENALLAADCSAGALADALTRALGLTAEERTRMQRAACDTAEEQFLYQHYLPQLQALLENR